MNWFEGSIPEAIAAAKTRKAIFVVYVRDSTEATKTTDEVLSRRDVVQLMEGARFVAIKLENTTEDAKQFSQIYPLVVLPSLFFISGETGMPLEVLGGPLSSDNLKQKINKLISDKPATDTSAPSPSGSGISNTPEDGGGSSSNQEKAAESCAKPITPPQPAAENTKPTDEEVTADPNAASQDQTASAAEASGASNDDDGASDQSLEERVERAKVLLAEKQNTSAREKAEGDRQKEIDRRKMGQEVAKKKKEQDDDKIKAAAKERRKDKEEDRIARERVKAQIAADRAEKVARAALLRGEEPPPSQAPAPNAAPSPPQPASSSNISRLKFRLPDGSSTISQFPAEAPLSEVQQYVEQNITLPFPNFTLASTVQSRPFTPDDQTTSLRELGLVPSAILAILPQSISSSPGRLVSNEGGIWGILWFMLTPVTFLYGLMQHYLLGRREPSTDRTGEPQPKRPREDSSVNTRQRPSTAYGRRGEARFRQQGNIHRLRNDGEDDDENNTWNGNSTQQM